MQPETGKELTQAQAINSALDACMEKYADVIVIGAGVPDPNGVFGTTSGLLEKYGPERVFDSPLSENGMTGVCIGAALSGLRPVMVHQRVEFALLAMDQLINNAAKWNYVFANQATVPLVVRVIFGPGSGHGPLDFQSLQNLFAHVPGLKVVMPVTPCDAKGMLISAIEDRNPVIFIEHRSLHTMMDKVPDEYYCVPLEKAKVVRQGSDVTIAAFSHRVIEALNAAEILAGHGIDVEVIDMRSVRPLDAGAVLDSVSKTGRLLVADPGHMKNSIASELLAHVVEAGFAYLKNAPARIMTHAAFADDSIELIKSILALCDAANIDVETIRIALINK